MAHFRSTSTSSLPSTQKSPPWPWWNIVFVYEGLFLLCSSLHRFIELKISIFLNSDFSWFSYLFQKSVGQFFPLQLLEKFLAEFLQAGKRPLCGKLGPVQFLLGISVHGYVEVEAGWWFSPWKRFLTGIASYEPLYFFATTFVCPLKASLIIIISLI